MNIQDYKVYDVQLASGKTMKMLGANLKSALRSGEMKINSWSKTWYSDS